MTPIRILLAVGVLVVATAVLAPISHARTACVDRILDEWVHPSKPIGTTHALRCYDLALIEAPEDVLLYTNFETDVRAAKQAAIREQQAKVGPPDDASPPAPTSPPAPPAPPATPAEPPAPAPAPPVALPEQELVLEPKQPASDPAGTTIADPLAVEEAPTIEDVVPIGDVAAARAEGEAADAPLIDVLRNIGPNDAGSVPVPLIVLTILCGLLAIIGGTVLAARHVQARRLAESPPLPPRTAGRGGADSDI